MPEIRIVSKDIKEEIIARIRNEGKSVSDLAKQYGVSIKAIYNWLRARSLRDTSILEISRLKRENQELFWLVGKLTRDLSMGNTKIKRVWRLSS
jgi:transposase-like protein